MFQAPHAVSASSWFSAGASNLGNNDAACIVGALLERQLAGLEESKWKQGIQGILQQLLDDTLKVYTTAERPVRRARVLLKKLELTERPEDVVQYQKEAQKLLVCKV